MDRKLKGRVAEAKVISYLIEKGYEVYLPFSNNSKYDVITYKDDIINRVSIKFTSTKNKYGKWLVELRQISRGNKKINIHKFNNKEFDTLAVYIGPEDKVVLIESSNVKTRSYNVRNE